MSLEEIQRLREETVKGGRVNHKHNEGLNMQDCEEAIGLGNLEVVDDLEKVVSAGRV